MEQALTPTALSLAAGISVPYASQIINGKRHPSRPLALSIYNKTGKKYGPLTGLSEADIATLARIEAATPSTSEAA